MREHQRHLTPRDRRILEFVARFRVATEDAIGVRCFRSADAARDSRGSDGARNVQRVIQRLVARTCLKKQSWGKGLTYYTMATNGFVTLEMSPRSTRSFTEQSLPVALAVMFYCVRHNLDRLTLDEFQNTYPELCRAGLRSSQYVLVETPKGIKLEMLIVDRGGAARRLRSRVRRVVAQRKPMKDFWSLIQSGRFRVNILTGTETQQDKILRHLERESFEPVEVVATVVPELADILILER